MDLTALKNVTQTNIATLQELQTQVGVALSQHQSTLTEIEQAEAAVPTMADIAALVNKALGK